MLMLLYFQYLTKKNIKDIGRENFSFSCKVIVGEYILFKDDEDGSKVGILFKCSSSTFCFMVVIFLNICSVTYLLSFVPLS